jgi:hypothetical protein
LRKLREINVFWKWALKKGPKTRAGARFSPWGCKKAAKTPSFCGFWPRALIALAAPREPFAVFGRGRGKSGQKPWILALGTQKRPKIRHFWRFVAPWGTFSAKNVEFLAFFRKKATALGFGRGFWQNSAFG